MDNLTGVEQLNTEWNNGLHQFLQLKHLKKFTPESLKAVFMANATYFQECYGQIYGMTGTLGATSDRDLLKHIYGLNLFYLPRFKKYLFKEDQGLVCQSQSNWHEAIKAEVETILKKNRSILIICKDVASANSINDFLANKHDIKVSALYISALQKFEIGTDEHPLGTKQVIIATNLAGRGTDLKTSKTLEKVNGLHVLMTYLGNRRVTQQAYGRTARRGNKGSAKTIIHNTYSDNLQELIEVKNYMDERRLEKFRLHTLQSIQIEEQLFQRFTELYKKIKTVLIEGERKGTISIFYLSLFKMYGKGYLDLQLNALKNHWSFWLDSKGETISNVPVLGAEVIFEEYEKFSEKMLAIAHEKPIFKFCRLPHDLNSLGKYFISIKRYRKAIECFDRVINEDSSYAGISYYYKACALGMQENSYKETARREIAQQLTLAESQFHKRMQELQYSSSMLKSIVQLTQEYGVGYSSNLYAKQVENEVNIYSRCVENIRDILGRDLSKNIINGLIKEPGLRKKLYAKIIADNKITKNYRFSKKIQLKEKNGILYFMRLNSFEVPDVPLPGMFHTVQSELLKLFNDTNENRSITKHVVDSEEFLSQDTMWEKLQELNWLEENTGGDDYYIITCDEYKLDELEFGFETINDERLKATLLLNQGEKLQLSIFPKDSLTDDDLEKIRSLLSQYDQIKAAQSATLTLPLSEDGKVIAVPDSLKGYSRFINSITQLPKFSSTEKKDGKLVLLKLLKTDIPLPENKKDAQNSLRNFLLKHGVIKSPVIRFSLKDTRSRSRIDELMSTIEKNLENHLKIVFPSDHEKYKAPLMESTKSIIGKLKSITEFKISLDHLKDFFEQGLCPPEIKQFEQILLNELIIFSKKVSRWSWGAFSVAMIGIAQIAAGVALQVLTAGLLASVGAALISEGISDVIFATHAGLTGQFEWKSYGTHKAISLALSTANILTMGFARSFSTGLSGAALGEELVSDVLLLSVRRAAVEVCKSTGGKLASIALEKIFSRLPNEIRLRFGYIVEQKIQYLPSMNQQMTKLNEQLTTLFTQTHNIDNTKETLEVLLKNIGNFKENKGVHGALYNIGTSIGEALPAQILMASNTNSAALLASFVSMAIDGSQNILSLVKAAMYAPKLLAKLNEKIEKLIKNQEKRTANKVNRQLTDADKKYIAGKLIEARSAVSDFIINKITEEVITPTMLKNAQGVISVIAGGVMEQIEEDQARRIQTMHEEEIAPQNTKESEVSTNTKDATPDQVVQDELPEVSRVKRAKNKKKKAAKVYSEKNIDADINYVSPDGKIKLKGRVVADKLSIDESGSVKIKGLSSGDKLEIVSAEPISAHGDKIKLKTSTYDGFKSYDPFKLKQKYDNHVERVVGENRFGKRHVKVGSRRLRVYRSESPIFVFFGGALRKSVLDLYRNNMENYYAQKQKLLDRKFKDISGKQDESIKKFVKSVEANIKSALAFIILRKKDQMVAKREVDSLSEDQIRSLYSEEKIDAEVSSIWHFLSRKSDAGEAFRYAMKRLNEIYPNDTSLINAVNNLKQFIKDLYCFNKLRHKVELDKVKLSCSQGIRSLSTKAEMSALFNHINSNRYAESTQLLKSGKLGRGGVLLSSMMATLTEAHGISQRMKQIIVTRFGVAMQRTLAAEGVRKEIQISLTRNQQILYLEVADHVTRGVTLYAKKIAELDKISLQLEDDADIWSEKMRQLRRKIKALSSPEEKQKLRSDLRAYRDKTKAWYVERRKKIKDYQVTINKFVKLHKKSNQKFLERLGQQNDNDINCMAFSEEVNGFITDELAKISKEIMTISSGSLERTFKKLIDEHFKTKGGESKTESNTKSPGANAL